ncbi:septal ring lytic transglycosylase RlpA family protein [Legionella sp. km772]|uniref:septal ring lytic transglycosylase RlpA family protein n=1 Tax=Legionella sp. km772 TaxID=2498111 RepID=UPI000F8DD3B9|nr:septal ring lytic transglycosylase RlpA family protein [Legionella sp. km772]RUR11989.1 septal ring lytic transglycosylase RlpA family protein [Legionella sp. km772]
MKRIALAVLILLSGCQNIEQKDVDIKKEDEKSSSYSTKSVHDKAIYDRYNNKGNRYTIKQDAAPKNPNNSKIKETKPTNEPMSRYGNPSEYRVDGRKYEVMKNSAGYKTRGIASWYGTKFHKQRTSSGEPYDMYVMSAAHKTLPLPTYIKVKNLDNGKTAIVKVNDRGPFHGDRLIDLSYAAAVKLGIFPKGTAHVEIETMMGPAGNAHYYLQAGAFNTESAAKILKDKLAKLTTSPVFIEHYQKHYVVRVGPFANKDMVNNLKTKLAQNGVSGTFSVLV